MTLRALRRFEDATERVAPARPGPRPGRGLAIATHRLDKSYGAHRVLEGLDVRVPAGQFAAIVGRSGCGKSTLLRLLLGLDQPSGGQFWFGDREQDRPDGGAVRIMFQEPRLLPWASVLANVEVGLGQTRSTPEGRERAFDALRHVELESRGGDWPAVLSGGQKQRVALARALVSRPRVLAFDEPLGALDALTRISMQKLLERVWRDQGFTAIMVTHDVAEAVTLADRVLLVEDGGIAMDVSIDLPRPRDRGSAEVAELEGRILRQLIGTSSADDGA
jgi:sulfonate transport system ATP-binding protein